ncbi:MAG: hypothetical protein MK135_00290 [Polyangiaceae bacterium]|nr:hypothetical protein [Polyangiaceae bacterium]
MVQRRTITTRRVLALLFASLSTLCFACSKQATPPETTKVYARNVTDGIDALPVTRISVDNPEPRAVTIEPDDKKGSTRVQAQPVPNGNQMGLGGSTAQGELDSPAPKTSPSAPETSL